MSPGSILEKVKKLREITGVGFKDCKNAIDENNGDIEKSVEYLRKKGIAKASKRMDRIAADGLVCISEKENIQVGGARTFGALTKPLHIRVCEPWTRYWQHVCAN